MTSNTSFKASKATRQACPLLLGLVGPSASGKTFSALRLATGIAEVYDGPIFYIDTEASRATHYADQFDFMHVAFDAPFSATRYMDAIEYCRNEGAGCVIVDSMTHEHSGPGGMLDQVDTFMESKGWQDKYRTQAYIKPKRERQKLKEYIIQLGGTVPLICCYRARTKLDWQPGKQPRDMGLQPETTSDLMYEMVQQFLLRPGCDGVPELVANTPEEKALIKSPSQFRDWFTDGVQLSEAIGKRFAEWARGDTVRRFDEARDLIEAADQLDTLKEIWGAINTEKSRYSSDEFNRLIELKNGRKEALSNAG